MNKEKTILIHNKLTALEKKMSGVKCISTMINRKIDRKFHLNLNDLTPSELDFEMGRRVANLRENADPRVYMNLKPDRSKITKAIMLFPFLLRMIFVKPVGIIRDFIFFNNAMIVRLKKIDSRLTELENKLTSVANSSKFENKSWSDMENS